MGGRAAEKYYSISIPCKPYIRKYASVMQDYPIHADSRSSLGCFLTACLEKNRYTERNYTHSFIHQHYTALLEIRISGFHFVRYGFDFPISKIVEINQFLENRFEEHLHDWVDARYIDRFKTERYGLIERFAHEHGILLSDGPNGVPKADILLESLVKTEYRMRKAIEKRKEKAIKSLGLFAPK